MNSLTRTPQGEVLRQGRFRAWVRYQRFTAAVLGLPTGHGCTGAGFRDRRYRGVA